VTVRDRDLRSSSSAQPTTVPLARRHLPGTVIKPDSGRHGKRRSSTAARARALAPGIPRAAPRRLPGAGIIGGCENRFQICGARKAPVPVLGGG
jgi:hypothetical protein